MVYADRAGKGYGGSFHSQSIYFEALDAASITGSIFDRNVIDGRTMVEGEFITRPGFGNARFDCKMIALQLETEDPLETRAVKPPGGAGIPRPSSASDVRRM